MICCNILDAHFKASAILHCFSEAGKYEGHHGETGFLPMRKQRRRSASQ